MSYKATSSTCGTSCRSNSPLIKFTVRTPAPPMIAIFIEIYSLTEPAVMLDAVGKHAVLLYKQNVGVFPHKLDDQPVFRFVVQFVPHGNADGQNPVKSPLLNGGNSASNQSTAEQHAKSGRFDRVWKGSCCTLYTPVLSVRRKKKTMILSHTAHGQKERVTLRLLYLINFSADKRLQFMANRSERQPIHRHTVILSLISLHDRAPDDIRPHRRSGSGSRG